MHVEQADGITSSVTMFEKIDSVAVGLLVEFLEVTNSWNKKRKRAECKKDWVENTFDADVERVIRKCYTPLIPKSICITKMLAVPITDKETKGKFL